MGNKKRGRPRKPRKISSSNIDNRTYFEYLYIRLGHLLPDKEKFITLATGIVCDIKNHLNDNELNVI